MCSSLVLVPASTATLTKSQAARRQRVLEAALDLGAEGGYDAVQMRDVATEANVALGTIYRYFASKDHLLAESLVEWARDLGRRVAQRPLVGDTLAERVINVLRRATRAMETEPNRSEAVITALSSTDPHAARCQREVGAVMGQIMAGLPGRLRPGHPGRHRAGAGPRLVLVARRVGQPVVRHQPGGRRAEIAAHLLLDQYSCSVARRPNILFVVSDQERERSWLPASVSLPWRERLMAEGLELANHWTHSAPCSPSRATMMTGRYLPGHGVPDNVFHPWHAELDPAIPTVGSALRAAGYRSSYIGKWHLSHAEPPDMDPYGYADWDGNDQHFMGWAGTGVHFDPLIASNAAAWLRSNVGGADPWFLTVALVNPHDVMWFPIDQPTYQAAHPDEAASSAASSRRRSGRTTRPSRRSPTPTPKSSTSCPPTSTTTSTPSPTRTASGGGTSSTASGATSTRPTRRRGCATSTTTSSCTAWPTTASASCSVRSRRRAGGTTP